MSGTDLCQSLELALGSMRVPESVTLGFLDPSQFPETTIIVHRLKNVLNSAIIEMSPEEILEGLGTQATNAIKTASVFEDKNIVALLLPADFDEFLHRWFTRAVNHAIGVEVSNGEQGVVGDIGNIIEKLRRVELEGKAGD